MWESQVLLTDGQVVLPRVLQFLPTFDEQLARYKWNILENPNQKKKKKGEIRQTSHTDFCRYILKVNFNVCLRKINFIHVDMVNYTLWRSQYPVTLPWFVNMYFGQIYQS